MFEITTVVIGFLLLAVLIAPIILYFFVAGDRRAEKERAAWERRERFGPYTVESSTLLRPRSEPSTPAETLLRGAEPRADTDASTLLHASDNSQP